MLSVVVKIFGKPKQEFDVKHKQLIVIKHYLNISDNITLKLAEDLRYIAGKNYVETGFKETLTENKKISNVFDNSWEPIVSLSVTVTESMSVTLSV